MRQLMTLRSRLEVFRHYACTGGPWFAVRMVPRLTDWEVVYGDRTMNALSHLGKPLTIWVVGTLRSINIYVGGDEQSPVLRLVLQLLSKDDEEALADIERMVHRSHKRTQGDVFRAQTLGGARGRKVSRL